MLAACLLAAAQLFTSGSDLQPQTYASPSGEYELFVDPSTRSGAESSRCRLSHRGQEVWASELPFTFQEAVVTDEGVAAGYSFTEGSQSFRGEFVVTILSPGGEVAYEEREDMQFSRFMHEPPDPRVVGLLYHPELDRLTLRIADPDVNRRSESWWTYDLGEASLVSKTEPWSGLEDTEYLEGYLAATVVPDTPLTLVHWRQAGPGELGHKDLGARFALLDQDLAVLWSLDLPDDYTAAPDSEETYGLLTTVRERGAILSLDDRRFELWLVQETQRVTFSVEPGVSNDPAWVVAELNRRPHVIAVTEELPPEPVSSIELRLLGSVLLGESASQQPAIRKVEEFRVLADGRIQFVRREGRRRFTLVKLASDGQVLEEVPFDPEPFNAKGFRLWTALPGGDWFLAVSPHEEGVACVSWRMSGSTGQALRLAPRECGWVTAADAFEQGVVTLDTRGTSYRWDTVTHSDLEGRAIWVEAERNGDSRDLTKLFSPEDVAVDQEGRVAVIGNIRHLVQVWGPGGEFESAFDLDTLLPAKANYPSGICPDLDGGWLIHDFNATTPIWRLARDGTVITGFVPRFADGSTVDELPRNLRRAGDGRLWTTDSTAFLRLDEDGRVDLTIGPAPDAGALTEAASCHIDHLGRILVQDERTRAVHVFDRTGRRLLVCVPAPADVADLNDYSPHYIVKDDGGLLIEIDGSAMGDSEMLEFAPDGTPQGRVEPALWRLVYQPGLGTALGRGRNLQRISAGGEVLATLSHHADGLWMSTPQFAIGPDGSFVVVDSLRGEDSRRLSLFDAEATLERSLSLPLTVVGDPAFSGEWVMLRKYGAGVFLVRIADGQSYQWSAATPAEGKKGSWQFGFSPDGQELWAVAEQSLRLYRYALPEGRIEAVPGAGE